MNIPLVSEYKIGFISHRIIQTFFGGFGYNVNQAEEISNLIVFYKFLVFIYPLVIGIIFSVIIETNCLSELFGALISGIISFLIMITIHLLAKRQTLIKINPIHNNEKVSESEKRFLPRIIPFAAKKPKVVILLHSIISSSLISLSVYNLQLSLIYKFVSNDWFLAFALFFASWLTLIISHHSLTISPPPETATYATTLNTSDLISSLNRPFHVLIVLSFQLIDWIAFNNLYQSIPMCAILLSIYPFLWLLGFMPPLPALIQWLIERINDIIFGGLLYSPIYQLVSLLLSVCVLIFCWAVDEPIVLIYISSVYGFLMSNDIISYLKAIKKMKVKISSLVIVISLLFSIFFINILTTNEFLNLFFINEWLIYSIFASLFFITTIKYSQSVYIFFGLLQNPIYPKCVSGIDVFVKFKMRWNSIIFIMKILIHFILPLLCLMDVNIELKQLFNSIKQEMNTNSESNEKLISFFISIAVLRIHRSIWQKSCLTAFIIIFVNFSNHINFFLISEFLPIQWLVVDFCLNVIISSLEKLYLVIVLMVTSVLLKKQRLRMSWYLFGFDIVIIPVIISMVLLSSIIWAPILPLFTLPIFLISFPRPMHFWPDTPSKSEIETVDTVYYQQLMPRFVQSLQKQCPLISSCKTGSFLLARFGDRLIWIQVLETGFNYIKIQIKGLELQETSCHAVEATTIDEILEEAFYSNSENRKMSKIFNTHFWFAIQPFDTIIVKTYSDARNVLTGVIDSPETFAVIKSLFARVFVWVILKYRMKKTNNLTIQESVELDLEKQVVNTNPNLEVNSVLKAKSEIVSQEKVFRTNNIVFSEWSDDEEETDVLGPDSNQNRQSSNISYQSNQIKIMNKSINEKIESNVESQSINSLKNLSKRLSISDDINISKSNINNRGIPPNSSDSNSNTLSSSDDCNAISTDKLQTDNSLSLCYISLLPKNEWLSAFFDFTYRGSINQSLYQFMFSDDWFKNVINTLCDNNLQLKDSEMISLIDSYKQVVSVCFSCILPTSRSLRNNEMSSQTIHQIFNGKVPDDGFNNKFFDSNKELYEITIKSFQYSLKLAIDQVLLGNDVQTHNDLIENLIDYDMNWFIGDDTSIEWKNCVIAEKRNLFSIGKDPIKECFTSHLLSLEEIAIHLCHMNRAVIEAIWSSLSLELLYLTNDDDERYSIQAHPVILRNVTVQAADAPLGYPLFISPPIIINHLNN